jgi:3-methyladenine DNA glycosylase AlkD
MVDIKYYTTVLFNEETGKEHYGLIPKEAEKMFKENSLENCWKIAMEYYSNELYCIQMLAIYIIGLLWNEKALNFMESTVSKNHSWQVQECLAISFNIFCKHNGYYSSLKTINEWINNENQNVMRAVIERLRVWIKRPYFENNSQEAINILSRIKNDKSEYVRKSFGNALKDISKARIM